MVNPLVICSIYDHVIWMKVTRMNSQMTVRFLASASDREWTSLTYNNNHNNNINNNNNPSALRGPPPSPPPPAPRRPSNNNNN